MAKAYWVAIYRSTPNPEAHAAYVKLAVPALTAHAHFLARGTPAQTYEAGLKERIVIVEFDSVADAIVTHDSRAIRQRSRRSTMRRNGISASSRGSHDRPLMSAFGGGFNRSTQHLLILLEKEVCDGGDCTDMVHAAAEG